MIWLVRGKSGRASLSLFQIWMWSLLVLASAVYVLALTGELLAITGGVLVLLGISGTSSVVAKIAAVQRGKAEQESATQMTAGVEEREPRWADLISTDDRFDLYKFQMLIFTGLAAVFVLTRIATTYDFPELPVGLLTLMGISNGVYLAGKATSSTIFELLDKKFRELETARAELAESEKALAAAEDAVAAAEQQLQTRAAEQKKLEEKLKAAPDDEKVAAELDAMNKSVKEARTEFDELSKRAAKQRDERQKKEEAVRKLQEEYELLKKKL